MPILEVGLVTGSEDLAICRALGRDVGIGDVLVVRKVPTRSSIMVLHHGQKSCLPILEALAFVVVLDATCTAK